MKLLSVQQILKRKQLVGNPAFENKVIYFLIKDNEIVYIGESTLYQSRIRAHQNQISYLNGEIIEKDFNYIAIEFVPDLTQEERKIKELMYIQKFNPKYNGQKIKAETIEAKRLICQFKKNKIKQDFRDKNAALSTTNKKICQNLLNSKS